MEDFTGISLGFCPPKKTENRCQGTRNLCTKERVSGGCRRCLSPQLWHTELALSQWLVYNVFSHGFCRAWYNQMGWNLQDPQSWWSHWWDVPGRIDRWKNTNLYHRKTIWQQTFGTTNANMFSMFISSFPGKLNSKHLKTANFSSPESSFPAKKNMFSVQPCRVSNPPVIWSYENLGAFLVGTRIPLTPNPFEPFIHLLW